jgi:hypothetical protein
MCFGRAGKRTIGLNREYSLPTRSSKGKISFALFVHPSKFP